MNTWPLIIKWLYRLAMDDIQTTNEILIFCDELDKLVTRLRKECKP